VRHRGGRGLREALELLDEAVGIGDEPVEPEPLIVDIIAASDGPA
jgi:hypothetical protein